MRYQIAEMQIVKSDFYRNLDTTFISKCSKATCPHRHVVQVIHSNLTHYAVKLADKQMTLEEIAVSFPASVLLGVENDG